MNFYQSGARISKDAIAGLLHEASLDQSPDKMLAVIGSALDDNHQLLIPESVVETVKEFTANGVQFPYAPSTGLPGLAQLLTNEYLGQKTFKDLSEIGVHKAEIVTAGGTHAISSTLVACSHPEDKIIIHNPHWAGFDSIVNSIGRQPLINFDTLDSTGAFNFIGLSETLAQNQSARSIVILNTPYDNPLGKSLDDQSWTKIGDIFKEHQSKTGKEILLILDIAYIDFGSGGKDYRRLNFLVDLFKKMSSSKFNVVIATTVSKSFGMYGARLGTAILLSSDQELTRNWIDVMGGVIRGTLSSINQPSQEIVMKILQDPKKLSYVHDYQYRTAKLMDKRLRFFIKNIENKLDPEIKLIKPDGGFFCTFEIKDSVLAEKISQSLIASHTYIPMLSGHFLRIPICEYPEASLLEVTKRLLNAFASVKVSS